jgi:CRISPR type I-D-associated protein Csc2
MNVSEFKSAIDDGTVEQIENERQSRYTHILLLREVTAPARFTTDGETVNTTRVRMGIPGQETVETRAVDLFYRKQPGAERRIAKSIQRDLLGDVSEDCKEDSMSPNDMRQNSPESVLFGSAAASEGVSQRSRVYYNTAYSLRDVPHITRQNTQNAPGDENRNVSTEGQGTWTPDFVLPGALFPSVVTLDSAVPEEVLFMLATLARTTRYGAGETRGGNVKNHFLGVFTSPTDSPSNLEISRQIVGNLAETDGFDGAEDVTTASTLPVDQVISETIECYQRLLDDQGIPFDHIEQDAVNSVVSALQKEGTLESVMKDQLDAVSDYVSRAPGSD